MLAWPPGGSQPHLFVGVVFGCHSNAKSSAVRCSVAPGSVPKVQLVTDEGSVKGEVSKPFDFLPDGNLVKADVQGQRLNQHLLVFLLD